MSWPIIRRIRRISPLGASLALIVAMFVVASPAQAVVGVNLTVDDTTVSEGESIELSWTSTDAVGLVASGSWSGNKAMPAGSEAISPPVGIHTYTLTATDGQGNVATDDVTVFVGSSTGPVTVINRCSTVDFTNNTDSTLFFQYLWYDASSEEQGSGDFAVTAGATHQLPREWPGGEWDVYADANFDNWLGVYGNLNVPVTCDEGPDDHPTVAPAAGIASR